MNKNQFLEELKELLKNMPKEDREEILFDYKEHFDIGIQDGRSEKEIASKLGNPEIIVKSLELNTVISKVEKNNYSGKILNIVVKAIGLGVSGVVLMPLILTLGAIIIALWAVEFAIGLSGAAFIVSPVLKYIIPEYINNPLPNFLSVIAGIGGVVLAYLGIGLMKKITIMFKKLILKYIKTNVEICKSKYR